jgi:serine phosphatase RsbU (regulator of sigma subunit)
MPLFVGSHNPFFEGAYQAGVFVLLVALVRSFMQRERAEVLATGLYAVCTVASLSIAPWAAGYAAALLCAIPLFFAFRRYGFAALLVAAVSASLFRETLAAGVFASEAALPLSAGVLSLVALLAIGIAGVKRSAREDEGKIEAPDYLKRLESERRVKYEIDLLSEMQLALLPERPPSVRGFEIGVRTVLATEAGGDLYDFAIDESGELWIAAGDVSGHGYSCGIQQAMVKAALASLVKAGRSPGEVLCEIDRVLRTGRSRRVFTSLALYRIDPRTGCGVFANAGHPFPLLLSETGCTEVSSPGLPLGHGPRRTYADSPLDLPIGGALVFASDGLFEGPDRFDEPYGYERPRELLRSVGLWRRPAESMVDALFADWRLHVGDGAPADDTTIVIVRRPTPTLA